MAHRSEEKSVQSNKKKEASQGLRGFILVPNQFESKASAFGVSALLFDGHSAVIEGGQISKGILPIGG